MPSTSRADIASLVTRFFADLCKRRLDDIKPTTRLELDLGLSSDLREALAPDLTALARSANDRARAVSREESRKLKTVASTAALVATKAGL